MMDSSMQRYCSGCSKSEETHSLLQQPKTSQVRNSCNSCACPINVKYRLPVISEKGAVVMLVWNFFFTTSLIACVIITDNTYSSALLTFACSTVLYPLIGWLADTRLGKFKVLCAAKFLLLVAIILKNTGTFIIGSDYIFYISLLTWSLALACYWSCIIPFVTEQTVGASAEEISFTLHWLVWGVCTGYSIASITCLLPKLHQEYMLYQFLVTLLSYIIAFIWLVAYHHLVMTKPVISNPIKLIIQVLSYARKHKYPERRSALTYWEDDYPSRLDIGKAKYGGPFTFEQVENVKTLLRLIALVVCINICHIDFWQKNQSVYYKYSKCKSSIMNAIGFISNYPTFYLSLIIFLGYPIYYFVIFPLFRKHLFTIVKRIGAGMLLLVLSYLACAIAEFVEVSLSDTSTNVTCIFKAPVTNECPTSIQLTGIIVPDLFKSLGVVITLLGMYELIIAQAPQEVKSLLLCITTGIAGAFVVLSYALHNLLSSFPIHLYPSCLFYYYTWYFAIGTLAFLLYVLVAKWYKLRVRDDVIPYHRIAEDYFEREQANRRAYIRARQLETGDEEYWRE